MVDSIVMKVVLQILLQIKMPREVSRTRISEKCPECNSGLELVIIEFNPFPGEEPSSYMTKKQCGCGYEIRVDDKPKNSNQNESRVGWFNDEEYSPQND